MQKSEVAALLAMISGFDGRTPSQAAVEAWHAALSVQVGGPPTFEDATFAVTAHYAKQTRWIMPADVAKFVERLRGTRRVCITVMPPEDGLTDERGNPTSQAAFSRIQEYRDSVRADVENGRYRPDPDRATVLNAMDVNLAGIDPRPVWNAELGWEAIEA